MAVTIQLFNHTVKLFAEGTNDFDDTYKLALYTEATFDADATTLSDLTLVEVAEENGYTAGGKELEFVEVVTTSVNGATFDCDDVVWTADGGPITARYAILYNYTVEESLVIAFIDFGAVQSAGDGTDFIVAWHLDGIFNWTVA